MIVLSFSSDIHYFDRQSSAIWRRPRGRYGPFPAIHKCRFCALIRRSLRLTNSSCRGHRLIFLEKLALQKIGDIAKRHQAVSRNAVSRSGKIVTGYEAAIKRSFAAYEITL
jgi:hypothetical protein